ncbi:MAG: hypothetical protein V3W19_05700 [Desulfatiglandales bacterium]
MPYIPEPVHNGSTKLSCRMLLIVLGVYIGATFLLTFPLALRWPNEVPGPPEDNLQGLWNFWWIKESLINLRQNPINMDYLYYPNGILLAFHTFSFFNTLLGFPLLFFFNLVSTYNIFLFISFPLSALGAYVLAYEVTGHRRASFLAGWAFAFSAYHITSAGHHLNLSSIQFIPWYAWALKRMECNPGLRQGALLGVFFVGASLSSWYYGIFLCFFTFIWMIVVRKKVPPVIYRPILAAIVIAIIGLLPFVGPMFYRILIESPNVLYEGYQGHLGGDLLAYILPGPDQSLVRGWSTLSNFYNRMGPFPWAAVVFLGVIPLGLGAYGVLRSPWNKTQFWVVGLAVFWVLSLGSVLQVNGIPLLSHLPYEWLVAKVPIVKMVRVPSRFVVMCTLSLAVLLAFGYVELENKFARQRKKRRWIIWWSCFILLAIESLHIPWTTTDPHRISHTDLFQWMRQDNHGKAMLELPMKGYIFNLVYVFRQTIHKKKLLFGIMSRVPDKSIRWIGEGPLLNFFLRTRPMNREFVKEMLGKLKEIEVGYVVLNGPFFMAQGPKGIDDFIRLREHLDDLAVRIREAEHSEILIYKIPF